MTEQATHISIVEGFFDALQNYDWATVHTLIDDNLVYNNVGFPTIYGRTQVMKFLHALEGRTYFEATLHRIAANGPVVLTERTDMLTIGPLRMKFWVCGVFDIHDGRITLWRDYFDVFDIAKATVRGLIGVVIPALRPQL